MSFIDGFVLAVPKENKQAFIDHAALINPMFMDMGLIRVVESWQSDVPKGKKNDFFTAVDADESEAVVFTFMEWPDKETRDSAMAKLQELVKDDPRFDREKHPVPFDGSRMIMGGFEPVYTLEK
ncbi:MAG: DUF1428 domain-containing protein [Pseudomonadota bacterium]